MSASVAIVMRQGPEYRPEHARWIARQVRRATDAPLICLSDAEIGDGVERVPLVCSWPGWWAKMEMFRPEIRGDLFYLDLDTVITGSLAGLVDRGRTTILRDFYIGGDALQSSVMYLTEADRRRVWSAWSKEPEVWMKRCHGRGDQAMLEFVLGDCDRWQDVAPGRLVSYKAGIRKAGRSDPPPGADMVIFHGDPRPWRIFSWKRPATWRRAAWVPPFPG